MKTRIGSSHLSDKRSLSYVRTTRPGLYQDFIENNFAVAVWWWWCGSALVLPINNVKCWFQNRFAVRHSKKSSWPVTGLLTRGPLKILNGIKLILDGQGNHLDSYTISLESFRSFRGPLFRKPVTGQELFLPFLTANRHLLPLQNLMCRHKKQFY